MLTLGIPTQRFTNMDNEQTQNRPLTSKIKTREGTLHGEKVNYHVRDDSVGESSGGSCEYYKVPILKPTTAPDPYIAECNDVIEALDMTYAEANMFKEIWRSAAARTLGKIKAGHNEVRGAEKVVFFADRNLIQKSNTL
jgi:hypothetical protein